MEKHNAELMYREEILELYKNPMNFGILENNTHTAKRSNPLCGDDIEVYLKIDKNRVTQVKFNGSGCAISIAASSLLTEKIKNMSTDEINKLDQDDVTRLLGIPVSPGRIKCALICLEAIKNAIKEEKNEQ